MALRAKAIEDLCHDRKTKDEAFRLFGIARANTAAGSGFDLGENRTALPAVCAYIASQRLNNTEVTLEAAQRTACQNKAKFKKLLEQVQKALAERRPAHVTYKTLLRGDLPETARIPPVAIEWMSKVEAAGRKVLEEEDDSASTGEEITCAVFMSLCNLISGQRLFHVNSLEEKYGTRTANMRYLTQVLRTECAKIKTAIRADCDKAAAAAAKSASASVSPRKSPSKPLRALPTGDSPKKRDAAPNADEELPASPTKKQKVSPALVTLDSIIRTRSMSSSPSKLPATPTKARRLLHTPSPTKSKSPSKRIIATPSPVKLARLTSPQPPSSNSEESELEEDDAPPPGRRRFRPVFRDQVQWAARDPRLADAAQLTREAEHMKRMIKRYGVPFPHLRRSSNRDGDGDVAMDSD